LFNKAHTNVNSKSGCFEINLVLCLGAEQQGEGVSAKTTRSAKNLKSLLFSGK